MATLYSGPINDFYRVSERNDGSLLVEVLHANQQWRRRLLGRNPRITSLPEDVLAPSDSNIRAAVLLRRIIEDFPEAFRHGQVEFTSQQSNPERSLNEHRSTDKVKAPRGAIRTPRRVSASDDASLRASALDRLIAREYFYKQICLLPVCIAQQLPKIPGLYVVVEQGQFLGRPIEGLPRTLRCVKVGMSKMGIRARVESYFGSSQRSAIPRRHVGDALLGRAIDLNQVFAGFPPAVLQDVRTLWNSGSSPSEAIARQPSIANQLGLSTSRDVTRLELPIEEAVTAYMQAFRFIAIGANPQDIFEIEDAANSLLRDVADVDPACRGWLGEHSSREAIHRYGLWAVNGVTTIYRPYLTHPCQGNCRDKQGRLIADWLASLARLIESK